MIVWGLKKISTISKQIRELELTILKYAVWEYNLISVVPGLRPLGFRGQHEKSSKPKMSIFSLDTWKGDMLGTGFSRLAEKLQSGDRGKSWTTDF